jgi:hypothetical protein
MIAFNTNRSSSRVSLPSPFRSCGPRRLERGSDGPRGARVPRLAHLDGAAAEYLCAGEAGIANAMPESAVTGEHLGGDGSGLPGLRYLLIAWLSTLGQRLALSGAK